MSTEETTHEEELPDDDKTQEIETEEGAEGEDEGEGEYKIGDQSFKTSEEAFAYANSLEHKNAIAEAQANAYRQAVTDGALGRADGQKVTQNPEDEDDPEFDQKFYEDPKKFLKEFEAKIIAKTESKVLGHVSQQSEDERLWSDFFKQNPDLADFKEDCEYTLAKHQADLKAVNSTRGQKAAMDFLAQKTRAKFQSYHEKSKPKRDLERTSSGPSLGSSVNVTRQPTKTQELDFAAEIRSLRGKRA